MRTKELHSLSPAELAAQITSLTEQYYAARESVRSGKEKNHAALKQLRRAVARARTVARLQSGG